MKILQVGLHSMPFAGFVVLASGLLACECVANGQDANDDTPEKATESKTSEKPEAKNDQQAGGSDEAQAESVALAKLGDPRAWEIWESMCAYLDSHRFLNINADTSVDWGFQSGNATSVSANHQFLEVVFYGPVYLKYTMSLPADQKIVVSRRLSELVVFNSHSNQIARTQYQAISDPLILGNFINPRRIAVVFLAGIVQNPSYADLSKEFTSLKFVSSEEYKLISRDGTETLKCHRLLITLNEILMDCWIASEGAPRPVAVTIKGESLPEAMVGIPPPPPPLPGFTETTEGKLDRVSWFSGKWSAAVFS